MAGTPIEPRPLTGLESAVVGKLLAEGGVEAGEYLCQVSQAQVVATWGEGSPSVDLIVQPGPARAVSRTEGIIAEGTVSDQHGSPVGELIVWVEDGWLSGIEYAWYTDERPAALPDPDRVEVYSRP
ncbi:hypothetical protein NN3_29260 [Nocardia neocaledoniensis NBRC 108232]|uniref:Uncharacterized protein n=1 Tax=Nocardia neocaledoniensis TaxID=236511 RepID=A0A317N5E2_9NOCA|nr:hypothetical protein [Nocardia neocaledoniensis]PWV70189.1 hypothetical protein DFR69_114156 [Nocardia neocaledoniensis]GEM31919.1 hypothetical protein NN3_29260 [Nocardia neocaledoniensis NBRC 108232]